MRKSLEHLQWRVDRIDTDNLYECVANMKEVLTEIIEHLDRALPLEVEPD